MEIFKYKGKTIEEQEEDESRQYILGIKEICSR